MVYRAQPYIMLGEVFYKRGHDDILRHCVNPSKVPMILKGCIMTFVEGIFLYGQLPKKSGELNIIGLLYLLMLLVMFETVTLVNMLGNQLLLKLCL